MAWGRREGYGDAASGGSISGAGAQVDQGSSGCDVEATCKATTEAADRTTCGGEGGRSMAALQLLVALEACVRDL